MDLRMLEVGLEMGLALALAGAGSGLALWCGAGWLARRRQARRMRAVDRIEHPAMLISDGGRVLHVNRALAALFDAPVPCSLEPLMTALVEEVDAGVLYRTARSAEDGGWAVRAVRLRAGRPEGRPEGSGEDTGCLLAVQDLGGCRSLWTLVPVLPDARPQPGPVPDAAPARPQDPTQPGAPGDAPSAGPSAAPDDALEPAAFAILDALPVPLAGFDRDGRLRWCNGWAREILAEDAIPGRALAQLAEPLGRPISQLLATARAGTGPAPGEMMRLRRNQAFVQLVLTPLPASAGDGLLGVLHDASEMRRLEDQFAQSQKMEAIGKLAGGVAHDFNNVLTAILGNCDLLLLRKEVDHPDYADLMQIAQNANRAAALVRQLLAFSRKQTLAPQVLAIQDVISDTRYLLDRLVGETVRLRTEFGDGRWSVRADQQQLEQVLMNLVVNARDAMDGVGTITISAARRRLEGPGEPVGDFVEIAVADTGPGIDPGVIDRIFDPFFTTKPKGEGTGLGLSTVYGIVRQSGGHISVESGTTRRGPGVAGGAQEGRGDGQGEGPEDGQGTVFRILLPQAGEDAEDAPPAPRPAAPRDLTGSGSILLVEDEAPVRAFAARALRLRGYEVAEAETAEEAMEMLSDPSFDVDLLVSDVVMPGMDGPTFAREARKLRPGLRLVLISGYAEESFRRNLTETDFHFLPKPFSLNELTARVKEALQAGVR